MPRPSGGKHRLYVSAIGLKIDPFRPYIEEIGYYNGKRNDIKLLKNVFIACFIWLENATK
jgi:hypothetical protein